MKVYDVKALMQVLSCGRNTALRIMQAAGFRLGYQPKSPWRITDESLQVYVTRRETKNI